MSNVVAAYVGVAVGVSLILTEWALIVMLRQVVREVRGFRRDLPPLIGSIAVVTLFAEALRTMNGRKKE